MIMKDWAIEKHDDMMYGYHINEVLYHKKSKFQDVKVVDTDKYGKIMFLDDCVMLTEKWEFIYHEMITHPVLFTHPCPEKVLIIGGGDGGTLREVLKHDDVKQVDMVEIDEDVIEISKRYFSSVSCGMGDHRAKILVDDGIRFVKDKKDEYDIIIIDSSDPVGPAEGLFNQEFYNNSSSALKQDGILISQSESPFYVEQFFLDAIKNIQSTYPITNVMTAPIPDYPFGLWTFTIGSKQVNPKESFNKEKYDRMNLALKFYNFDIHQSAFVLPNFIRDLLK